MDANSNWSTIQGHWNEYKERVKEHWERLTDEDLSQIKGDRNRLVEALQRRYGLAKEKVEEQLSEFVSSAGGWLEQAKNKVADVAERGREYFREHDFSDMMADCRTLIARYPIQTALLGLGVGYILGRIFTSSDRS
jgi:uncharacterized protein YjbJ (UPF0337 family)